MLANNPYGLGGCVCRSDPVHVPWKNRCYPLYGRGPCASGQYLRLEDNVAVCVANPCGSDGLVPFNGGCGQLESEESCPGSGVLKVDAATLELKCQLEVRQISLTPYRCGPRSPIFHSPFCRPKWGLWFASNWGLFIALCWYKHSVFKHQLIECWAYFLMNHNYCWLYNIFGVNHWLITHFVHSFIMYIHRISVKYQYWFE